MAPNKKAQAQGIFVLILVIIVIYVINSYEKEATITISNSKLIPSQLIMNSNQNLTIINKDPIAHTIKIGETEFNLIDTSSKQIRLDPGEYIISSRESMEIKGKIIVK